MFMNVIFTIPRLNENPLISGINVNIIRNKLNHDQRKLLIGLIGELISFHVYEQLGYKIVKSTNTFDRIKDAVVNDKYLMEVKTVIRQTFGPAVTLDASQFKKWDKADYRVFVVVPHEKIISDKPHLDNTIRVFQCIDYKNCSIEHGVNGVYRRYWLHSLDLINTIIDQHLFEIMFELSTSSYKTTTETERVI